MNEKDNITRLSSGPNFEKAINTFIDHIESLSTSLPHILSTIEQTKQKALKLHQEFLNKDCEKKIGENGIYFAIKPEHARRNRLLRKEVNQSIIAHTIIQRNYIVSLVSQFDSFIGSLIRTMYYVKPELLNESEKQLTFSNLLEFENVAAAREFIIEKEIESVLRDSHTGHFKWIEKKIDSPLLKDLPIWSTFIELTERRNLYVHNNGVVSNHYLKMCNDNNVTLSPDIQIGDTLIVDADYFDKAFKCVFELGLKLAQVMWRKLMPNNLLDADNNLLSISFELILSCQYTLAQEILDFTEKYIKKFSSDDIKFRLILNRAQTYKWIGEQEKCKEIIKSKDWSACSDIFRLASQVLLDDFESAAKTMRILGKDHKEIDKNAYKEWPIFKEFRKQQNFKKCFEELFAEEVEIKERYASSGFKIIDITTFEKILDDCLKIAQEKTNGFLSSKFFVETHVSQKGYDIGSTWEIYNKLEHNNKIQTYKHVDPNGKFPPINAVRRIVK